MTNKPEQLTVLEGNRLIARFMGGFERDMGHGDMTWDHESYMSPLVCKSDFELIYHSSWDWLMPVVEKIQHLKTRRTDNELSMFSNLSFGLDLCGHNNDCSAHILGSITFCDKDGIYIKFRKVDYPGIWVWHKKDPIDAAYEAVIQFIQWYNEQSKNNYAVNESKDQQLTVNQADHESKIFLLPPRIWPIRW